MWGYGGKYYWRKRNNQGGGGGGRCEAIVVVFAWMSSEERNLKNHVDLYDSLLWDSLVCHSQFLNMFVFSLLLSLFSLISLFNKNCLGFYYMFRFLPDKAADLASGLVSELVKVIDVLSYYIFIIFILFYFRYSNP